MSKNPAMKAQGERLAAARLAAGFKSSRAAAVELEWPVSTYSAHERGDRTIGQDDAERYAGRFGTTTAQHILFGTGAAAEQEGDDLFRPNATTGKPVHLGSTVERIPVFGQAIGGDDGRFVLNGNKIADVLAPPTLMGVRDAYAVFVVGESMEPRYRAGETAYVHPRLPVRKGDFVIVQIRADQEEAPFGYIKEFVSMDARRLRLRQFNPEKTVEFAAGRVISVHRIVLAG